MLVWILIPACYRIESLLARHGSFNALQKFRLAALHLDLVKNDISEQHMRKLWDEIIRIEGHLRQLAQIEEDLEKRCLSLKPIPSSQEDKNRRSRWAKESAAIPKKYWFLERQLYAQEILLPEGFLLRAYNLWRSNPRWYLHPYLINDCAGNGGCCSRDCGCCEKRGRTPGRRRGVGHCTVECGCCAISRGFDIRNNPKDSAKLLKMFASAMKNANNANITYGRRLLGAYFFGTNYGAGAVPRWK